MQAARSLYSSNLRYGTDLSKTMTSQVTRPQFSACFSGVAQPVASVFFKEHGSNRRSARFATKASEELLPIPKINRDQRPPQVLVRRLETHELAEKVKQPPHVIKGEMLKSPTVASVNSYVADNPLMLFSKSYCPFCSQVKMLLSEKEQEPTIVELDKIGNGPALQEALSSVTGQRTVPQLFIGGQFIGGCDDTLEANSSGQLDELLATLSK